MAEAALKKWFAKHSNSKNSKSEQAKSEQAHKNIMSKLTKTVKVSKLTKTVKVSKLTIESSQSNPRITDREEEEITTT